MNLYITSDKVGSESGGGLVTHHESEALKEIGPTKVLDQRGPTSPDVFQADHELSFDIENEKPILAHFYSGTFSKTIGKLKSLGCKITYTAAAHNIELSKKEHRRLGLEFNYPHLVDPQLWRNYVRGYLDADVVICPSEHSTDCMRSYGCKRIEIIPHGCEIPENVAAFPDKFVVGYLGAVGPDKGLIYLLQAWKRLNYKDALLVFAGSQSISNFMVDLINKFGGGSICLSGWVNNVSDFYNSLSCLVQASVSEGFGLEILEAMAHGRIVIASEGAGASFLLPKEYIVKRADVDDLAERIDSIKKNGVQSSQATLLRDIAKQYTWDKIRASYVRLWRRLL